MRNSMRHALGSPDALSNRIYDTFQLEFLCAAGALFQ